MCKRMCWSIWVISSVTLLLVDLRSVALLQKDTTTRRCYNCGSSTSNSTVECTQPSSVQCPSERPYCGTTASLSVTAKDSSSLVCAAPTGRLCSLRFCQQKQTYQITCVCEIDLCNGFFSKKFLQQLLDFTSNNPNLNNQTDPTDALFNATQINETTIYEARSLLTEITTFIPTTMKQVKHENLPQAEPLKQDATAPSDDDEDEGEGSGSIEETRLQKRPASVPAAPSSFLPADENNASPLFLNFLVTTPLFLYVIV